MLGFAELEGGKTVVVGRRKAIFWYYCIFFETFHYVNGFCHGHSL
jgi:hypothetical protein